MDVEVAIIGAGPSGMTAGIFAARAGLKVVCFEQMAIGGQMSASYSVQNYPGFENIDGFELGERIHNQAIKFGVEFVYERVESVEKKGALFVLRCHNSDYRAKNLIIACGCDKNKLNIENEEKLIGHGISYCASCDGNFFKGKDVAVVGGGDTAVENVKYLSHLAKKVYLICRGEKLKANLVDVSYIKKLKNVQVVTSAKITKINGNEFLESIEFEKGGELTQLKVDGLFVAIGSHPRLDFLKMKVEVDNAGYIIVNKEQQTNVKNLYACGDIVSKKFRQIITACSEGAIAGNACTNRGKV